MRPRNRDPLPGNRLIKAILSLSPAAFWVCDDSSSPLRDIVGNLGATVTGSPTYGVAAPPPIGKGITWPGGAAYATTSPSIPTPTASVSVLAVWSTTDASAAFRTLLGRGAASQHSWDIRLHTSHVVQFLAFQSNSAVHATASTTGATNDGPLWHLAVGSFDGTTIRCGRDAAATVESTTLTGSWHTASTAAVQVAARNNATPFIGTIAHVAIWNDRVITDTERRWLYSIMAGG